MTDRSVLFPGSRPGPVTPTLPLVSALVRRGHRVSYLHLGVPMIGVPQMPEQDANAHRVEELGCGRRLDPRTVDAATLRSTVDTVVTDPSVRSAVDAMSGRLRAADGPATGADALEALVAA